MQMSLPGLLLLCSDPYLYHAIYDWLAKLSMFRAFLASSSPVPGQDIHPLFSRHVSGLRRVVNAQLTFGKSLTGA